MKRYLACQTSQTRYFKFSFMLFCFVSIPASTRAKNELSVLQPGFLSVRVYGDRMYKG